MYGDLLLDRLGVKFLGPAPLHLWAALLGGGFAFLVGGLAHTSTMSRNEKFWVDQVTVPHPLPPRGTTRGGERHGGGGTLKQVTENVSKKIL